MTRWYRAYEGTVTDSKNAEVALIAETSRSVVIAVWHAILESCAVTQGAGRFEATARRIAASLCEPVAVIERVFAGMTELAMIDGDVVCAWAKRQFESDSSTERSRKHRATPCNGDATLQQQHATPPETETYTERKKDLRTVAVATRPAVDAYFQRFWEVYPKRKGGDPRKPALAAFLSAVRSGIDPETIISGAQSYADSCRLERIVDTPYVVQAMKWLRQARWEVDAPKAAQTVPAGHQIRIGTPQWDAWRAYHVDRNERFSMKRMDDAADSGQPLTVATEWPPGQERAA